MQHQVHALGGRHNYQCLETFCTFTLNHAGLSYCFRPGFNDVLSKKVFKVDFCDCCVTSV